MSNVTIPVENTDDISDGYHTFGELYEHRITLWIALCKRLQGYNVYGDANNHVERYRLVWASTQHHDGSSFGDWFILGYEREHGKQITYHLPAKYWSEVCEFAEILEKAPEFDGHTPQDVLQRIAAL